MLKKLIFSFDFYLIYLDNTIEDFWKTHLQKIIQNMNINVRLQIGKYIAIIKKTPALPYNKIFVSL